LFGLFVRRAAKRPGHPEKDAWLPGRSTPLFYAIYKARAQGDAASRGGMIEMTLLIWCALVAAAIMEVGGDALIRKGLRGSGWAVIVAGCLVLAFYGLMVNTVKWDFSKLLGIYAAFFAVVSVLCGRLAFKEAVPSSTWLGLALIVAGGLVIQFGRAPIE
jgi:small multidrug resistance family-3 protein